jgi:hypothetical protein
LIQVNGVWTDGNRLVDQLLGFRYRAHDCRGPWGRPWSEPNPGGGTIFRLTLKALSKRELTDGV